MTSLSDRVEAATADQQCEMLEQAYQACNGGKLFDQPATDGFQKTHARWQRFLSMLAVEAYESAAMTLVPEGWSILFAWNGERCVADVHTKPIGNPDGVWPAHSSACSAALALTAASLRARGL